MLNLFKKTTSSFIPSSQLCWKISPGLVPYEEALFFMEKYVEDIYKKKKPGCIWLLEHPSLYTYGTSSNFQEDLCLLPNDLPFPLYETGRGGRITYHGPGQRIIYCMIDLKTLSPLPDLKAFVNLLETWIIDTLKELKIEAFRQEGLIGIWVKGRDEKILKIAALGIRVRHWISFHGISLNIDPDLSHYNSIVPCGIQNFGVTSLRELGYKGTIKDIDYILKKTCPFKT
ncbi:MAG: lipoyl(octanoyl) transferase LipB [Proteobacteria bacterium]|nr:lipoyl(octanoyl) transferase LipB [Pseudomonadota bacterium]